MALDPVCYLYLFVTLAIDQSNYLNVPMIYSRFQKHLPSGKLT